MVSVLPIYITSMFLTTIIKAILSLIATVIIMKHHNVRLLFNILEATLITDTNYNSVVRRLWVTKMSSASSVRGLGGTSSIGSSHIWGG